MCEKTRTFECEREKREREKTEGKKILYWGREERQRDLIMDKRYIEHGLIIP